MSDICLGDRFYFNNYCVRKKLSLPDILVVSDISKEGFITAEYESHAVDQRPRMFAKKNLLFDSNLNPKRQDPAWIFIKAQDETVAQRSD